MCLRCIGATFVTSLVFGAAIGLTVLSVRSVSESRARAASVHKLEDRQSQISFYFEDAPLHEVAKFVGNVTRRHISADPRVNMKVPVTFISYSAMSKSEAYQSFLRLLQTQQLSITTEGKHITIVPQQNLPVRFKTMGYKVEAVGYKVGGKINEEPTAKQSSLFAQARYQLLNPDTMKGAVIQIEALGCTATKITFSTVAVGSIWSRLGLRAGDSIEMPNNMPPFRPFKGSLTVELERRGETVQLQYVQP